MKKALLVIVLAVIAVQIKAQEEKNEELKEANQISLPDLTLSDLNGEKINVAQYGKAGKMTLIGFWATWCSPCKQELTNFSDVYKEWKRKYDLQIVAVSIDDSKDIAKVKSYLGKQKWGYEVLLDVNQDLKRALNVASVPFIVVVNQHGKIVFTHSGYIEGDEYVLEQELQKLKK